VCNNKQPLLGVRIKTFIETAQYAFQYGLQPRQTVDQRKRIHESDADVLPSFEIVSTTRFAVFLHQTICERISAAVFHGKYFLELRFQPSSLAIFLYQDSMRYAGRNKMPA
jgi:hypothetical protein